MEKRQTRQKQIVYDMLVKLGHPSATELYEAVHRVHKTISKATVFRILRESAKEGSALRLGVGDEKDRYDATIYPHYHVRCLLCGRVDDVAMPYEQGLDNLFEEKSGYQIATHTIVFFGTCPYCSKT